MIGVIATFQIQPGKGEAFEQLLAELAVDVRANEPDVLFYELTRSRTEPDTYKVVEFYRNQEALDLHVRTDYIRAAMTKMATMLAAKPIPEFLDTIG